MSLSFRLSIHYQAAQCIPLPCGPPLGPFQNFIVNAYACEGQGLPLKFRKIMEPDYIFLARLSNRIITGAHPTIGIREDWAPPECRGRGTFMGL